ncbi:arylesterase [Ramlibacter tataouinensis]|uniref:Arylesterase n=1 Tax=Ramlibacter tataouinensis TaxID=94132 RepID=A0A140HLA6_9BURK|nr:arylesterase [Ramlibacter tataouinensis]AMO25639.1 arylesterase [Ramlibacter tataouinensis]
MDSDISCAGWKRRHFIAAALTAPWTLANAAAPRTILVVGDSLSAEYGLSRGTGWVALLQERLSQQKIAARLVNASISGDTTSGGRSRLQSLLTQHKPDIVVIELGGNDALRGLPLQMTEDNLAHMAQAARKSGASVLIVGVQVPPNYGADYANRFAGLFEKVAKANQASGAPFLLAGLVDGPDPARWFQPDRIHPTAEAQPRMLDNVWPDLKKLLR